MSLRLSNQLTIEETDARNAKIKALRLDGWSIKEISELCYLTEAQVRNILRPFGIKMYCKNKNRTSVKDGKEWARQKLSVEHLKTRDNEILRLYQSGVSTPKIAKQIGLSAARVRQILCQLSKNPSIKQIKRNVDQGMKILQCMPLQAYIDAKYGGVRNRMAVDWGISPSTVQSWQEASKPIYYVERDGEAAIHSELAVKTEQTEQRGGKGHES